jgi:hypothetical protein
MTSSTQSSTNDTRNRVQGEQGEGDVLHQLSNKQAAVGLLAFAGAWIATLEREKRPKTRGWLRYLNVALLLGGTIQMIRSVVTDYESRKAQLYFQEIDASKEMTQENLVSNAIMHDTPLSANAIEPSTSFSKRLQTGPTDRNR